MNKKFNKEIYILRLAITTNCILNCRYCFVKKDGRVISYAMTKQAINFFLSSPGKQKLLIIYGGEPLLHFDLLQKIIIFTQKKAKILGKSLIISVGTNGILLNQNQLDFFRKTNNKLAISIDGQRKFHNKARIFKNKKGSFDSIFKKIPLITENIKKENLCILFGVLPSSARKMYDNLLFLVNLGFDSVNIEPIQSSQFKWSRKQKKAFLTNLIKIIKYIYKNIHRGNFVFLNSVNREIRDKRLSTRKNTCPFFENLEVYPQGEMAFSPFLINSKDKDQYILGNVNMALLARYRFCDYNSGSENCKNCWQNYQGKGNFDFGESNDVLKLRNIYSVYLARKILSLSKKENVFKKYIKEAKKRIFE